MPNNPLISVIVPAYNAEKTLEKCVDSLTAQTCRELEILIVNDCSTDGTLALAQRLAAADERVRVLSTPQNAGPSLTRNLGLAEAKGDWIAFCDSDDYLEPQTYEAALDAADQNGADCVVWSYMSEYGETQKEKHLFAGDCVMTNSDLFVCILGPVGERLAHPEHIHSLSPLWSKLFKRSVIRVNGLTVREISEIGSEDLFFCAQYAAACDPDGKSVYLDRCFYHYIKGSGDSVSGKYRPAYTALMQRLNDALDALCAGRADEERGRRAVLDRRALCLINIGLNELAAADGGRVIRKRLKQALNEPKTGQALKQLDFSFLPLKWKVFFLCARLRRAFPFYCLLRAMQKLITRHD